jgi:glycosyltransferase involved in cell wall biosynthesis
MRIVFGVHQFFPKYSTGTEVHTLDLAREMRRRGHEVMIVTHQRTHAAVDTAHDAIERYRYDDFPVYAIVDVPPLSWEATGSAYDSRVSAERFAALMHELAPDLVHFTHVMRLGIGALRALLRTGVPYVVTLTDFFALCPRIILMDRAGRLCDGPLFNDCIWCMTGSRVLPLHSIALPEDAAAMYTETLNVEGLAVAEEQRAAGQRYHLLRYYLAGASKLIAPTRFLHEMFVRNGYAAEWLLYSPFAVDEDQLADHAHQPSATSVRIGFLGSVTEHKGPHVLIEAFRRLPREDARLEIWGEMPDPVYAERIRGLAGDDPRITLHGRFAPKDQPDILARLDVIVVPSLWHENTPLVLCAAVHAGIPVVGSNVGGVTELVTDEENGLVYPAGDVVELHNALRRLIEDPALRSRLRGHRRTFPTAREQGAVLEAVYRAAIATNTAKKSYDRSERR